MRLEIEHKCAWGNDRYYPKNELAEGLRKLTKRESFTKEQVRLLKKLGFVIVLTEYTPEI